MVSFFSADYFEVKKKGGLSQFQTMMAYLGGSALQTVGDNPVTAYRQLVAVSSLGDANRTRLGRGGYWGGWG